MLVFPEPVDPRNPGVFPHVYIVHPVWIIKNCLNRISQSAAESVPPLYFRTRETNDKTKKHKKTKPYPIKTKKHGTTINKVQKSKTRNSGFNNLGTLTSVLCELETPVLKDMT